jgi:glutathione S-transferase
MKNMRLEDKVIHHDVLADPKEMEALVTLTGKQQVPCLVVDGKPMHESQDINRFLYQAFYG